MTVRKLAILKLEGNLEYSGFEVTLEIWLEGRQRIAEPPPGRLPANPDLLGCLHQWRQSYRNLNNPTSRIKPKGIYGGSTNQVATCRKLRDQLHRKFIVWLEEQSFQVIDKRLREELHREEEIRILIRSSDDNIRRLPWHLWDVIERYPKAEIALSAPTSEFVVREIAPSGQVRILAILGNSAGLNLDADRQFIENLPGAAIQFLDNPQRHELNDQLWNRSWDILFFAGHSATEGKKGRLDINETESLTLDELRYGLRQAIAQGLQLAIFNSCDGLGLAYELEQLQIPQLIVMREPVPDQIAQAFLKQFLTAYAGGLSLTLSVRQAREQLQGWEGDFPCASWLPVLCQHPDPTAIPPTWQSLWDRRSPSRNRQRFSRLRWSALRLNRLSLNRNGRAIAWISLITAILVVGIRLSGILQPLELQAFDQMMRLRPDEGIDRNLTIIEITDADIAMQKQNGEQMQYTSLQGELFEYSLSNQSLTRLLKVLEKYQPRVIGLDLIRDFRIDPGALELQKQFASMPLIAICKAGNPNDPNIPTIDPPPDISITQVGFSNFFLDDDAVLRRQILGLVPRDFQHTSCKTNRSFGVQVASAYLDQPQIDSDQGDYDDLYLAGKIYPVLRPHTGGYQRIPQDWGGNQIMLNYRASQKIAERYTLAEMFKQPNPSNIQDKIVLIGVTAKDKDYHVTPYGTISGVEIHAHMISQLVNAALKGRPLIQFWSQLQEVVWILGWGITGGITAWMIKIRYKWAWLFRIGMIVIVVGVLSFICASLLLFGYWIPFIPALLSEFLTGSTVWLYYSYWLQRSNRSFSKL